MNLIFDQVFILFIPIVIGYFAVKVKIVDDSFAKNLSAFLFNITLPCTIISAMQFDFEPKMLIVSGVIIIIGAVVTFFFWIFGFYLSKTLKASGYEKKIIQYAVAFGNFSFMGYPVAKVFLGDEGLFYATIFSIPVYVLLQSIGMATLLPKKEGDKNFKLDYVLNPPLIGIYIGFLLFAFQIKLPFFINETINSLGKVTIPLAMALVGLALSKAPLLGSFTNFRAYIITAFRLIIMPLLVYFILRLFNFDEITTKLPVIISMMPIASNIIIVTTNYDGDTVTAAQYVLLSTLFSLITIPLMGYIL